MTWDDSTGYSWVPAIVLTSVMVIFLLDFGAEQYVDLKYGFSHGPSIENVITSAPHNRDTHRTLTHQQMHSGDQDPAFHADNEIQVGKNDVQQDSEKGTPTTSVNEAIERSFRQQIAAFLILEFGVIFHSVIIGLNLGTAGEEFNTLYPVLVFHQSFEGLGIGARMSAIPFPNRLSWLPWVLCAGYGLTTPIAIAAGLGVRTTYNGAAFEASIVSGVLDSVSAGILIYTGLVELLARDFLFNGELDRTKSWRLTFMIGCVLLGAALMALLGKWA